MGALKFHGSSQNFKTFNDSDQCSSSHGNVECMNPDISLIFPKVFRSLLL